MQVTPIVSRLGAGVSLAGVAKSFGAVHAVRGIDVDIAPGETVALLGPNGAGKSTTLDMLLGLTEPDAGAIGVFDMTAHEAVAAGRIAAMLQTGSLVQFLTIRELITMFASLYPSPLAVGDVLRQTGLTELADRRTDKLSGGQTQRVRFAAALVSGADLLVLDEPTVALDVEARHEFWTSMRAVAASGKTVIFATHYLEEADAYADRIILMANGLVVADGPATEIKGRVGGRTIRATLPGADIGELRRLPTVTNVERHGESVAVTCGDSDSVLRTILNAYADARDIEVRGAGLEAAFLELTAAADNADARSSR